MTVPLYWKRKTLLAKIETTEGTDAAPAGATDAVLATEVQLSPQEGTDVSRELERPFMGGQPTLVTGMHARLSFRVELQGSGAAGTAPGWGALMRACGFAQVIVAATSVTYNPISTGFESVTIKLNIDGTLFTLTGARGNVRVRVDAQGIPYLEFEFWGRYVAPADAAMPTVTLTGFQVPLVANSANTPTFTIGGFAAVVRSFSLDAGNQVEPRFLIGSERIMIVDRADQIEMRIEARPLATWNPFALAVAGTTAALSMTHGTVAGRRAVLAAPALQIQRVQGLEQEQNITEWPLRAVPLPVTGNDQWTLALT